LNDIVPNVTLSSLVRSGRGSGVRASLTGLFRRLTILRRGTVWWREILLIGILYGAYEISRGLGDVKMTSALKNGRAILHLEQVWHLAPERVLNGALEHATFIAVAASYFYSLMHYIVTPVVLVWMYRKHKDHYGQARTALAISTAVGLVGYLLLPTAPPRMLKNSGLRDTLADTSHWGWWGGEGSVPRGFGSFTNQFAAMPSLHVGWALWCGVLIAIHARRRWVKALGVAYPVMTTVVVMATGNHYLLDAVAGALVMATGALLSSALPKRTGGVVIGPERQSLDDVVAGRSMTAVRAAAAATYTRHALNKRELEPASGGSADAQLCRTRQ